MTFPNATQGQKTEETPEYLQEESGLLSGRSTPPTAENDVSQLELVRLAAQQVCKVFEVLTIFLNLENSTCVSRPCSD